MREIKAVSTEGIFDKRSRLSEPELGAVVNRFENIKAPAIIETEKAKSALLQGRQASSEQIKELDRELERRINQIDEDLAFVKRLNRAIVLSESGLRHLEQIYHEEYIDLDRQKGHI